MSLNRRDYLHYTVSDREKKLRNGETDDEKLFRLIREKTSTRADPKSRYCPVCKLEGEGIQKLKYIEEELMCSNCGFKPIVDEANPMKPPLAPDDEIKSGNTFGESLLQTRTYSLSKFASRRKARHRINSRHNMMDILNSVNKINPSIPELDEIM